jgi:hypothetical protein
MRYNLIRKFDKQVITTFFQKPTKQEIRDFILQYLGETETKYYSIAKAK